MDSGGVRGMNWETGIDLCILPCIKQIASRNLLYSTGSSTQCSVTIGGMAEVRRRSKMEGVYVYI